MPTQGQDPVSSSNYQWLAIVLEENTGLPAPQGAGAIRISFPASNSTGMRSSKATDPPTVILFALASTVVLLKKPRSTLIPFSRAPNEVLYPWPRPDARNGTLLTAENFTYSKLLA